MYKVFRKVMAVVAVVCCLCMNAGATGSEPIAIPYDDAKVESAAIFLQPEKSCLTASV